MAPSALAARAAAAEGQHYMIASCHVRYSLPDLDDHPGPFMPEDVWQRQRQDLLDNRHIRVANPGCREFHEHFIRTRRLEPYRLDDERSARSVDDGRLDRQQCGAILADVRAC